MVYLLVPGASGCSRTIQPLMICLLRTLIDWSSLSKVFIQTKLLNCILAMSIGG